MGILSKKEKRGHWTLHTHFLRKDVYECSICHCKSDKAYKKCPSCGAAMGKTVYDPSWVDEAVDMEIINDDDFLI